MPSSILNCSSSECMHKREHLEELTHEALEKQLECCEACEQGVFKDNFIAAQTYEIVATYWAQMHNFLMAKCAKS